jgi:hypothetical protein
VAAAAFEQMSADPVGFVTAFDRAPWPYQAANLRDVLERQPDGKFVRPVAVISKPRQNAKSTLSAWAALWRLFTDPHCHENVSVALDRSSAGIILGDARRIVLGSELLMSCVDTDYGMTRSEIRLKDARRSLVKSADAVFSRGLRPSMVCYDELGWSADEGQLYAVLSAAQAAQYAPLILVTSTVGPIQAGTLWDLFQAAGRGDPTVRLLYTNENESPLITDEYLERQRGLMPNHIFAREHMNVWSAGTDSFCAQKQWEQATQGPDPVRDHDAGPCFLFADLGWAHDESVVAVARPVAGLVEVIGMEIFKGSRERPVEMAAVRARIEEMVRALCVRRVTIESPQGLSMTQELHVPRNVEVTMLYPTAISNRERWGALYASLQAGSVRLPHDQMLRRQLLTLTIRQGLNGWRVEDVPSIHNDRAVACAGALFSAVEDARPKWKHISFMAATSYGVVNAKMEVIDSPTPAFDEQIAQMSESRLVRVCQSVVAGEFLASVQRRFSLESQVLPRRILETRLGLIQPGGRPPTT